MLFKRFFTSSQVAKKKIKYLATKRGIVENEIIFEKFINQHYDRLEEKDLQLFTDLLHEYDWDIFAWITGQRAAPEKYSNSSLLGLLRESSKKK